VELKLDSGIEVESQGVATVFTRGASLLRHQPPGDLCLLEAFYRRIPRLSLTLIWRMRD
jgi:hypothetical protein